MDTVGQFTGSPHDIFWRGINTGFLHIGEALFDGDEIGDFIGRIALQFREAILVRMCLTSSHVDRSLASRLKRYCSDAGTRESVEKYAWIGGYHQVVRVGSRLATCVGPTRRASLAYIGKSVSRRWCCCSSSVRNLLGVGMDSTVGGDEQFAIEGNAELLVAYAIARLRSWARS